MDTMTHLLAAALFILFFHAFKVTRLADRQQQVQGKLATTSVQMTPLSSAVPFLHDHSAGTSRIVYTEQQTVCPA